MSHLCNKIALCHIVAAAVLAGPTFANIAAAEPLAFVDPAHRSATSIFDQALRSQSAAQLSDSQDATEMPARLRRQIVDYPTSEARGTVVIDTPNTYLYYVLGGGKAMRYGIGVGRDGFTWSGVEAVARKAEWPDWVPPAEMIARQPYLPRFMAGGLGNPLGARAIYLGGTIYRIHGTNQPSTIGGRVSSGCIRMVNDDVIDLYGRVDVGTKVVVLPAEAHRMPDQTAPIRSASMPESPGSKSLRSSSLR
jgi:lipoprotein-anchoring transpeptidase ErfK/SrfK